MRRTRSNRISRARSLLFQAAFILSIVVGCSSGLDTANPAQKAQVSIYVDNTVLPVEVSIGETIQKALDQAQITLSSLDRVSPPSYTVITEDGDIHVTRVSEEFEIEEIVIPFARQTVRNESLPEGETLLIQPGINGIQQITYRRLFEDGVEVSRTIFKSEVLSEAKPEIVMVGVQTPFVSVPLRGKFAYLTAGNAWIMEDNSSNRRPLVTTGDLDGHIFSLSPDGEWLLFTRKTEHDLTERINNLWVLNLVEEDAEPQFITAKNIIHFADWQPDETRTIYYSTVEPRATAPGWQANNDLNKLVFDAEGVVLQIKTIVEPNAGGIYGWWGTSFAWSSDGKRMAYARPDSIGLVDLEEGTLEPLIDVLPFQTGSEWAWVPGIRWTQDHRVLYSVIHTPKAGIISEESSPIFDLVGLIPGDDLAIPLVSEVGMFAYPVPSPSYAGDRSTIAYLQAIFPEQSESSRYQLVVMDRDGSNRQVLFPAEGSPGIEPQEVLWEPVYSEQVQTIGLIYQGNLWFIYPETGQFQQLTGDGTIIKADWK